MSNSQDEREFEASQMSTMQTAQCLMAVCCTAPIGVCMMKNAMGNPPDARKLSEGEAKPYIEGLQGKSKASTKIGYCQDSYGFSTFSF